MSTGTSADRDQFWFFWRGKDGGDLPDDVAPSRSIRNAEPQLDTQLRKGIRSSSRSRHGEEEETAMMLGRESERTVTIISQSLLLFHSRSNIYISVFSSNWVFFSFGSVLIRDVCRVIDGRISLPLLLLFNKYCMTQVGELSQQNKPKTAAAAAMNQTCVQKGPFYVGKVIPPPTDGPNKICRKI